MESPLSYRCKALEGKKTEDMSVFGKIERKSGIIGNGGGVGLALPIGSRAMFDVMAGYNSLTVKHK